MENESKSYITEHRGLVASALMRNLLGKGFSRIIIRSRVELDLTNQAATEAFFAQVPEFMASNRVHAQTKTFSQKRRHYAESVALIRTYTGRCAAQVAPDLAMVSMVQVTKKQATGMNLFVSTIDDWLQFFGTSENTAKTRDNGGLS